MRKNDEDVLRQFKEYGFHYDATTGTLYSNKNFPIKNFNCRIYSPKKGIDLGCMKGRLCWYLHYNEVPPTIIKYKDGDPNNCKLDNMTLSELLTFDTEYHKKKSEEWRLRNGYNVGVKGRPQGSPNVEPRKTNKPTTNKLYLNNLELTYEIILSQGKGKLTNKAEEMLISICDNMIRKFNYKYDEDRYDCKMTGLLQILEKWKGFDHIKHNNSFAYFSEVSKRAIAAGFNQIHWKDSPYQEIPKKISLSKFHD